MIDQSMHQAKTDSELVQLAKQNPDYFAVLMARYGDSLLRYIKRISYFPDEDAQDILQEVFIKIYRNLNDYDDSLKFSSWVYRITHNHVIDTIRKVTIRPNTVSMEENEIFKLIRSSINIEKEMIAKDYLEKIKDVIFRLPLQYREVMILRFLEEKDYEEIMDILKKPKGTVATMINRGRKILIRELVLEGIKIN